MKHFLTEYCEELLNTPDIQERRRTRATRRCSSACIENYGNGKAGLHSCTSPWAATRAAARGYKGRVGLHELLVGTDPLKKLIQEHARVAEMLRHGAGRGHAHAEDGRHGEGAAGRHRHGTGPGGLHQVNARGTDGKGTRPGERGAATAISQARAGLERDRAHDARSSPSSSTSTPSASRSPQERDINAAAGDHPHRREEPHARRRGHALPPGGRQAAVRDRAHRQPLDRHGRQLRQRGPVLPDPPARQGRQAQLHDDRGLRGAHRTRR